ncbi:MAG: YbaB/EbfC family nucleoid-associated protein [Lachnospiraceae bacterium]|nr:YbaB/EbfC family nucleoid-associated protein [Lachnospiraceae bacterium]
MARRNQFQGIPGSANNMMKQAQRLQRQMEEQQKELEEKEFTAAAGGAVEITVSGKRQLTGVKIDPEAVDPDDVEMLQDMIIAAANEALKKVDDAQAANMSKMTGGLGGFPF